MKMIVVVGLFVFFVLPVCGEDWRMEGEPMNISAPQGYVLELGPERILRIQGNGEIQGLVITDESTIQKGIYFEPLDITLSLQDLHFFNDVQHATKVVLSRMHLQQIYQEKQIAETKRDKTLSFLRRMAKELNLMVQDLLEFLLTK